MNIALIFAGGSGVRMGNTGKPKQFLQVNGKEIIIYTVEKFEKHELIDEIVIVCIEQWIPYLNELLKKYEIKKVKYVIPGGLTGQESIYKGLSCVNDNFEDNPIVLIHDGVRPLVRKDHITAIIESVRKNGNAVSVSDVIDSIVIVDENNLITGSPKRSTTFHSRAPQGFWFKEIWECHKMARSEGVSDMVNSAALMEHYGYKLYAVKGDNDNIKITTPLDFYLFRSLLDASKDYRILE
jgi:2-C-methyl-D-erythritol 4-phosphate cytidylyltransferase